MSNWEPVREWEEPEPEPEPIANPSPWYKLGGILSADEDTFDLEEALIFLREFDDEFGRYKAKFDLIDKLEKKCKEYIRSTGEVPDVPGVTVKFGKPSKRKLPYTKQLIEMSARDDEIKGAIARLEELHSHLTPEGQEVLVEIRQTFAKRYMPLSSFYHEKDISPNIKIII
jgi:hypothetical protein